MVVGLRVVVNLIDALMMLHSCNICITLSNRSVLPSFLLRMARTISDWVNEGSLRDFIHWKTFFASSLVWSIPINPKATVACSASRVAICSACAIVVGVIVRFCVSYSATCIRPARRRAEPQIYLLPSVTTFIQGDICDRQLVNTILQRYAIDTIVYFAAESHVDRSIQGPAPFIQTNVVSTFTLLEAARQYWHLEKNWDSMQCRFHHISTDEVYGSLAAKDVPFTEQTAYAANSPYSASKAGSDHLVRAYFHMYQLPVTMSNCSNNYGPYQHTEK